MRSVSFGVLLCSLLFAGCSQEDASDAVQQDPPAVAATPKAPRITRPLTPEELADASTRIQKLADSTDQQLRHVHGLTLWEKVRLRRDANAEQIARAHQLGIQPGSDFNSLVARHMLVELPDSTEYWTLHNLNFSVPYVTPNAYRMLVEIAQGFQHQLDSLGVPRYRLVITSALRTPDKQAALRRVNRNASRIESAHEFGTTVDVAYRRFAAPLNSAPIPADTVITLADSTMVKVGSQRAAELQAVLGRVILNMQQEGKLMVMMEHAQTVYHMTVGRPLVNTANRQAAFSD